jgi:hypothetical protein
MTVRADANRKRWAVRLGFSAALMAALAFAVVARDAADRRVETVSGPAAPEWSTVFPEAQEIRIVSPQGTMTLGREGQDWALEDRGGYPVEPSSLTALHRFMSALSFSGARTHDPENFERLGVTDPAEGGSGVRLTAFDASGAPLIDMIFGAERAGGVFIRRAGEVETSAADGEPPDLASPAFWLDLDFFNLERVDISEARITPEGGAQPYVLARGAPAASDFVLLDPRGYELITAAAANAPGGAITDLRFFDVRPASPTDGPVVGTHAAKTFEGVEIGLEVIRDGEDAWVRISTRALDPANADAVARADALTARTQGWLYKLPPYAADRLIRPLSGIARPITAADAPTTP